VASNDPVERHLVASIASAHARIGLTYDELRARTAPGRAAAFARFEQRADPEGRLDPAERRRQAKELQRAHMLEMSRRALRARRARTAEAAR
jgi:hypothetical protein